MKYEIYVFSVSSAYNAYCQIGINTHNQTLIKVNHPKYIHNLITGWLDRLYRVVELLFYYRSNVTTDSRPNFSQPNDAARCRGCTLLLYLGIVDKLRNSLFLGQRDKKQRI
ncbi:hypothetical protein [Dysgonomonas macrotermitis]|uniref:hypothetical protein n=1 Tax=Dysgonomonas macrotermitis TaxID=1346286 RepID=UPI000782BD1E|nr:hypothetical protein [Dysgonomonas macrotermitis]